ncbi:phage holin family protein [Luteimonas aquatica]|uniref:phage holin family protein n=1 Tax=Luteimonas aquatica TaxID=450364 RepID=UPI001F562E43|nr:phage holin family protein [Luteimonas aquatica]
MNEAPHQDAGTAKAPHLDESVRRIRSAGRATLDSALDTGRALRHLIGADLALARSATGRALAWLAVAIVFGASSWLLTMGALIALLQALGLSWLASISIAAALSLLVTGLAAWRVSVFFDYAGMHATRRQLARLGIGDEEDEGAATPDARPHPSAPGPSAPRSSAP